MNITKISLFSLIFMAHCIQGVITEEVKRIEELKKSIENKLINFDTLLLATTKQIKLAEQQKDNDQKEYESYMTQLAQAWFPELDHSAPQIKNYKGNYQSYSYNLDEYVYDNNGSEGKYYALLKILQTNEHGYTILKDNFERGKRLGDVEYLQELEKTIQNYEKNIKSNLDKLATAK